MSNQLTNEAEDRRVLGVDHRLQIQFLYALPMSVRAKLKQRRITTCGQLLRAAAAAPGRTTLLAETGVDPAILMVFIRRADLARIDGIGVVFGRLLEDVGVHEIEELAKREANELHAALRDYNRQERLARRSPTLEEVADWIAKAQKLPIVITGE